MPSCVAHKTASAPKAASDTIQYQDIEVFPASKKFTVMVSKSISPPLSSPCRHLIQNPGQVITKEALSLDVLGKRLAAFDRAIDMHISNLRKKIPERNDGKSRIKTLRRGYLLVEWRLMRIPKITSLYGRIFAIFWFTMLLVLLSVLSLPHLDPRVARCLPDHLQ